MADLTVSNDIDNFMQSANAAAAKAAIDVAKVEDPVLDATARLALGTPAGTYVEETETPNVIFFQTGADASDAASWIALRSNDDSDFTLPTVALAVADPFTEGAAADIDALGKATDGSYWIKTGLNNTDWEQILISTNGEFVTNIKLATVAAPQVLPAGVAGVLADGQMVIGDGTIAPGVRQSRVLFSAGPNVSLYETGVQDVVLVPSFEAKVGKYYDLTVQLVTYDENDTGLGEVRMLSSGVAGSIGFRKVDAVESFVFDNNSLFAGNLNDGSEFSQSLKFAAPADETISLVFRVSGNADEIGVTSFFCQLIEL